MSKKILLVEDDEAILDAVKEALESADYLVECATNGQEALDWLNATQELPSLIVLDLKMPKMDGYEFRKYQVRNPKISDVPVLLMTADGQIDGSKNMIGVKDIIKNPLNFIVF